MAICDTMRPRHNEYRWVCFFYLAKDFNEKNGDLTMARAIQIRRGTAQQHADFTGKIGEVTMDTTNNTLRIHDGATVGGTVLAKKTEIPDLSGCMKRPDYFNTIFAQNGIIYYADCDYLALMAKGVGDEATLHVSQNADMSNAVRIAEVFIVASGQIFFDIQAIIPKGCYYRFENVDEIRLCKMI